MRNEQPFQKRLKAYSYMHLTARSWYCSVKYMVAKCVSQLHYINVQHFLLYFISFLFFKSSFVAAVSEKYLKTDKFLIVITINQNMSL